MRFALTFFSALLPSISFAFDYGPVGNSMFWVVLVLWSAFISYLLYVRRASIGKLLAYFAQSLLPERQVVRQGVVPPPYAHTEKLTQKIVHHPQMSLTHHAPPQRQEVLQRTVEVPRFAPMSRPARREDVRFAAAERSYHEHEIIARAERALKRASNAQEGLHATTYDRVEYEPHAPERDEHTSRVHEYVTTPSPEIDDGAVSEVQVVKKPDMAPHHLAPFPVAKSVVHHNEHKVHTARVHKKEEISVIAPKASEVFHDSLSLEKDEHGMPLLILKRVAK